MRRLVDRYANEVCVALCARQPVPEWVRSALPGLPDTMQAADRHAHQYERAIIDLAESVILAPRVGETFAGAIIEISHTGAGRDKPSHGSAHSGIVMLRDPAIEAKVTSNAELPLGDEVAVKLLQADPARRMVSFARVDSG
jgi:exoribonuclease R